MLADMLKKLPKGGTVLLRVPTAPYRCPPGPYERASLIAWYLKNNKPGSKIFVLDANDDVVSKGKLFKESWADLYKGVLEYVPDVDVNGIDPSTNTLKTSKGDLKGDFINLHNWKIDYAIRDVTFEEIGEKKFDKPIALNGYGIIEDTNGLYTSGRLHINGIMPNQIDVRHYYDNATLNITLKNIENLLNLKIVKRNSDDNNYAFATEGIIKDTPFKMDGVVGLKNKVVHYALHNLLIDNMQLSASGTIDINNLVLDTLIENKNNDFPIKPAFNNRSYL